MEVLTNSGWTPANTLDSLIVSIRAQLVTGGGRLDSTNKSDYSEQEAKGKRRPITTNIFSKDAFDRMVQIHGWH
jgi:hypothetical protein